jgi:hypothetical protein
MPTSRSAKAKAATRGGRVDRTALLSVEPIPDGEDPDVRDLDISGNRWDRRRKPQVAAPLRLAAWPACETTRLGEPLARNPSRRASTTTAVPGHAWGVTDPATTVAGYAVVDIDGVIADVRHRLYHVERRPKDWAAFFAAAEGDGLLAEGVAVVQRLAADHAIVYLTGRPDRLRGQTESWLRRHGLPAGELVMRQEGDRRPARLTKIGLLRRLARRGRVAVLVDDDPQVCAAARRAGFNVLQADWMVRPPALDEAQEVEGGPDNGPVWAATAGRQVRPASIARVIE